MKSKEEIEKKIGFKLEYDEWQTYVNGNDWNNFEGETIHHKKLDDKSYNAIKDLLLESLENGDIETADVCSNILDVYESDRMKVSSDKELIGKREKLQSDFLSNYTAEIQSMEIENLDKDKISEILDKYKMILKFGNGKSLDEEKHQLAEIIQDKINLKIQQLDEQISNLKEHIEIPENEDKISELQEQIENIEEKYQGDNLINGHKAQRLREQGADMADIMQAIQEYRAVNLRGRDSSNYYVRQFNELNSKVAKKTEYLEKKLALLKEYSNIPGNAKRIAQVEAEIESMQDSWIVAQEGYNNIDGIIQTATNRMSKIERRIEQGKKELEMMNPMSTMFLQKQNEIESLTKEAKRYEKYIEKMKETKQNIANGTDQSFMGQHHRDRLEREEKEKVETTKEKISELASQLEQLKENIEIPENDLRAEEIQDEIENLEQTIGMTEYKRARINEQGATIQENELLIQNSNDPFFTLSRAKDNITKREIYLQNKLGLIKENIDIEGNKDREQQILQELEQIKYQKRVYGEIEKSYKERYNRLKELREIVKSYGGLNYKGEKEFQDLKLEIEDDKANTYIKMKEEAETKVTEDIEQEKIQAEEQARIKAEQEAKAKAEEQARIKAEQEAKAKAEEQAKIKAEQEAKAKAEEQARIKAEQEAKAKAEEQDRNEMNARSMYDHWRFMADLEKNGNYDELIFTEAEKLTKLYPENLEYRETVNKLKSKMYEPLQEEKTRPQEESIRDEVGDKNDLENHNMQIQERTEPTVELWMNRFNGWYSAIDRVSQNVKAKLVRMKSDIVNAISNTLKERMHKKQQNQEPSER